MARRDPARRSSRRFTTSGVPALPATWHLQVWRRVPIFSQCGTVVFKHANRSWSRCSGKSLAPASQRRETPRMEETAGTRHPVCSTFPGRHQSAVSAWQRVDGQRHRHRSRNHQAVRRPIRHRTLLHERRNRTTHSCYPTISWTH